MTKPTAPYAFAVATTVDGAAEWLLEAGPIRERHRSPYVSIPDLGDAIWERLAEARKVVEPSCVYGYGPSRDGLLARLYDTGWQPVSDPEERTAGRRAASRLAGELAADPQTFRRPRTHRLALPPHVAADPWTVATDASLSSDAGAAAWAYVTGAGWYGANICPGLTVTQAEMRAAHEAIAAFRPGQVTIVSDSQTAVGALQHLDDRARGRPWARRQVARYLAILGPALYGDAYQDVARHVGVRSLWYRRTTHPLHDYADDLSRRVRRGQAPPTRAPDGKPAYGASA